jgi:hypothetical protein
MPGAVQAFKVLDRKYLEVRDQKLAHKSHAQVQREEEKRPMQHDTVRQLCCSIATSQLRKRRKGLIVLSIAGIEAYGFRQT